jgi:hypothetical protein
MIGKTGGLGESEMQKTQPLTPALSHLMGEGESFSVFFANQARYLPNHRWQ